jgi:hypothetical protein
MMEGLIARLLGTSGVTALVGNRVSPGRRPQAGPLPDIVLTTISGAPVYSDQGEHGLASARVQIDCWGRTYTEAKAVARAVKASISAFVGSAGGVTFQYILRDTERDFNEGGGNAAEYFFRTNLDVLVWYET